jgi:hypothetical protein
MLNLRELNLVKALLFISKIINLSNKIVSFE